MRREGGVVTSRLFYGAGLLFFSLFLIYPLLFILMQAFYSKGEISLLYFGFILKNQSYREAILNTLGVGACATIFSLLIGGSLAVVMVRTQFFGKKVFGILLLLPLFVPPFVGSLGVKQLLGRFGSINLLLMSARFVTTPVDFLGEYKAIGIAGIQALHLFPLVYLTLASTLASISPHLEEAGYVVGAKRSAIWMKNI